MKWSLLSEGVVLSLVGMLGSWSWKQPRSAAGHLWLGQSFTDWVSLLSLSSTHTLWDYWERERVLSWLTRKRSWRRGLTLLLVVWTLPRTPQSCWESSQPLWSEDGAKFWSVAAVLQAIQLPVCMGFPRQSSFQSVWASTCPTCVPPAVRAGHPQDHCCSLRGGQLW